MSDKTGGVQSNGIGFTGLLTVLFIGLKLGHVIAWSWWWVLSPLWITAAFLIVILLVALLIAAVVTRNKPRRY